MLVGNVHLIAGTEADIPQTLELLRTSGIKTKANPDLYLRVYKSFGIGEARELSERAGLHPISAAHRTFVIAVDSMTAEAQNALLKTLEEPRGNALFVFIHPAPQTLLPTLRSRAQTLALREEHKGRSFMPVQDFLKATPAKRLDMLKPLLEKDDNDKRDYGAMLAFLASLERTLAKNPASLVPVYRARKYITDRGALTKPLLEQIALLV